MDHDTSMAMGMDRASPSGGKFGITIDKAEVKAGAVTFAAVNTSSELVHEMLVAPVADPSAPMVYDEEEDRVDEDAANALGEVEELEPGQSGTLTLTLEPGTYVLYCNMPLHMSLGMWTLLTVTS